jgi:hypothetical protein
MSLAAVGSGLTVMGSATVAGAAPGPVALARGREELKPPPRAVARALLARRVVVAIRRGCCCCCCGRLIPLGRPRRGEGAAEEDLADTALRALPCAGRLASRASTGLWAGWRCWGCGCRPRGRRGCCSGVSSKDRSAAAGLMCVDLLDCSTEGGFLLFSQFPLSPLPSLPGRLLHDIRQREDVVLGIFLGFLLDDGAPACHRAGDSCHWRCRCWAAAVIWCLPVAPSLFVVVVLLLRRRPWHWPEAGAGAQGWDRSRAAGCFACAGFRPDRSHRCLRGAGPGSVRMSPCLLRRVPGCCLRTHQ